MIEIKSLTKKYGNYTAVNSLDLEIKSGDIFCLLGANGAGKSTTINIILNFLEPTSGIVKVNNLDVTKNSLETKKYIAYIPEQVMLYNSFSGLENLEYFSSLSNKRIIRFFIRSWFGFRTF
jgi:ABC-2 type transport system ATP-binding protein